MKHLLLSIFLFTFSLLSFGQCPATPITLSSQADVDNFTTNYPGCTEILNGLTISGADITDLNPIQVITAIANGLVIENNSLLINLEGLNSITEFNDGNLIISNNDLLENVSALSNVVHMSEFAIFTMNISNNPMLNSLNGLQGINSHEYVYINNNDSLINLNGLSESFVYFENFVVSNNDLLQNFGSIGGVYINEIQIMNNLMLNDISALDNFSTSIPATIITDNPNLSICNNLPICASMYELYSCCGGSHPNFLIQNNAEGCSSFAQVAQSCGLVPSNDECSEAINITVGDTIEAYNDLASASAEIPSCNDTDRADVWFTFNSGSNSSVDIIVDTGYNIQLWEGSCGSLSEVPGSCTTGSLLDFAVTTDTTYYVQVWSCAGCRVESMATGLFTILVQDGLLSTNEVEVATVELYPNPVKNSLNINSTQTINNIEIYNLLGQQMIKTSPKVLNTEVDLTTLSQGMYLLKVKSLSSEQTFKIFKE